MELVIIACLRMKTLAGIVVAGALAIAPLWEYALHDYQRNRVLAFINPALDPATYPRTPMLCRRGHRKPRTST
jgi:cell division protein FtsW (lipid II flippase)